MTTPNAPEDYKPEMPQGFTLPEGAKIDVDHPRFKEAQRNAHALGMSQATFSDLLALEAKRVVRAARAADPSKIPGYDKMTTQQKFALADKRNAAR
jgi:hypothetical protein